MALPLVLFLLINMDILPEVQTTFFSIPKMDHLRTSKVALSHIGENLVHFWNIVIRQSDSEIQSIPFDGSGLYYPFSTPLLALSLLFYVWKIVRDVKAREFCPEVIILIQLLAGILIGATIQGAVNRLNITFLPIVMILGTGIDSLRRQFHAENALPVVVLYYLISLHMFNTYYFVSYMDDAKSAFHVGYREALVTADEAADQTGATVYIDHTYYPITLFYEQILSSDYQEAKEKGTGLSTSGRYQTYQSEEPLDLNSIYIIKDGSDHSRFTEEYFTFNAYGCYTVAIPRDAQGE